MFRIGIDLGGTKIEAVVLDTDGRELFRKRTPTDQEKGYEHILSRIKSLHDEAVGAIDGAPNTFGLGAPGAVSPKTGLLKNSNTACLNRRPLNADLERILGRRIVMQNDANCFAMAEALFGAGKNHRLVFGVIMGTGCGGGIVHKGEVIAGLQGIAGEWGHTSIDPSGPGCYCGQRGCVETYISGGGLETRHAEKFGRKLSAREIVANYAKGEPEATETISGFFQHFGRSLANVINTIDPDVVVLGGGLSNFDALYTEGVQAVAKHVFSDSLETPIVKNRLGDSAGVIGAALIGI